MRRTTGSSAARPRALKPFRTGAATGATPLTAAAMPLARIILSGRPAAALAATPAALLWSALMINGITDVDLSFLKTNFFSLTSPAQCTKVETRLSLPTSFNNSANAADRIAASPPPGGDSAIPTAVAEAAPLVDCADAIGAADISG